MKPKKLTPSQLRRAAAYFGAIGGRKVRGAAKRNATTFTPELARAIAAARSPESQRRNVDYAALARKAAEARKKKGGPP